MRAILVAVDYTDILRHTLPYNRHHFSEVMVVTAPFDEETIELAKAWDCQLYVTNVFYQDGADFNKWAALEEGLDEFGRYGWLVFLDADIVWPEDLGDLHLAKGRLYTPLARQVWSGEIPPEIIPAEDTWHTYEEYCTPNEWAGYTHIFHARDRRLGPPPWHDLNWRHAGCGDTFFQLKWHRNMKRRLPFEVLHLGDYGKNWCGRVTQYLDGSFPPERFNRKLRLKWYLRKRREETRKTRKLMRPTFKWERLKE